MGLLDKAKAQAQQLAVKAQEGVKTGQEKMEHAQAAKRADALLRDLGVQVYLQQVGRPTADGPVEIARLTAELQRYEAEQGPIDATPKAGPVATPEQAPVPPSAAPPAAPPAAGAVPPPPAYAPPPAPAAPAPPAAPPAPPAPPQGGNFSLDDL